MEAGNTGWLTERIHPAPPPQRVLRPSHWPRTNLEDRQIDEIARFEASMRRDELRGLPSCFQMPEDMAL